MQRLKKSFFVSAIVLSLVIPQLIFSLYKLSGGVVAGVLSDFMTGVIFALLAVLIASVFPYVDYLIYAYYKNPNEQVSIDIKDLISRGHYLKALVYADNNHSQFSKLTVHSAHFQILLLLLGFYFVFTYPKVFGLTLLSALILNLSFRLYDLRHFEHNWFWAYKGNISHSFVKGFIILNFFLGVLYAMFV